MTKSERKKLGDALRLLQEKMDQIFNGDDSAKLELSSTGFSLFGPEGTVLVDDKRDGGTY